MKKLACLSSVPTRNPTDEILVLDNIVVDQLEHLPSLRKARLHPLRLRNACRSHRCPHFSIRVDTRGSSAENPTRCRIICDDYSWILWVLRMDRCGIYVSGKPL